MNKFLLALCKALWSGFRSPHIKGNFLTLLPQKMYLKYPKKSSFFADRILRID